MELDSLYQEVILDHYKHPQNKALKADPTRQVKHVNTSCGDEIVLNIHLVDNRVTDVTWEGIGCSISQASTSVMSELMRGKTSDEAISLVDEFQAMIQSKGTITGDEERLGDGIAFAGVAKFPARVKCALLGWMAVKDAILQSRSKN